MTPSSLLLPDAPAEMATWPLLAHAGADLDTIGLSSTVVAYGLVAALAVVALVLNQRWRRPRFSTTGTDSTIVAGPPEAAGGGTGATGDDPFGGPVWSVARALSATLLVIVIAVGWAGSTQIGANPVPAAVLFFTLAGPVLVLLLGDLWTPLQPHAALAGAIRRCLGRSPEAPGPFAGGLGWVPAVGLASYAVFWLAVPDGLQPRVIAGWLTVYSVVMVTIGVALGPAAARRLEGFAVLFGAIGRLSPVRWDAGRPRFGNPLVAVGQAGVDRRELAVLVVAMGATVFDAVSATPWWAGVLGVRSEVGYTLFNGAGLAWMIGAVGVVWWAAARGSARLAGGRATAAAPQASAQAPAHPQLAGAQLAGAVTTAPGPGAASPGTHSVTGPTDPPRAGDTPAEVEADTDDADGDPTVDVRILAPALAVLVVGFTLAHQFGSMLINGLSTLALGSDPLARGWDLFGTRSLYADPDSWLTLSGWVALGGVVVATLVATIVAWDRWLASDHHRPEASMPAVFAVMAAAGVVGVALLVGG